MLQDHGKYAFKIVVDFIVPEPQHAKSLRFKPLSTLRILFFLGGVLPAIQLNDQLCLVTDEIDDVGSDGLLSAKFAASESVAAKLLPKLVLMRGRVAPECSCEGRQF